MGKIIRTAAAGSAESGDALVTVTPCEELRLRISSTLYGRFGKAIERTAADMLQRLDVPAAEVAIEDHGALDWVLRARLETALRRGREA